MAELQISELMGSQLSHLLRYEDRNSMAHSIEARVPFVDRPSLELALALSDSGKIKNGYRKYALREYAATMLPREIAWRKNKTGFDAPDGIWLGRLLPVMQEKVSGSRLVKIICAAPPRLAALPLSAAWRLYNMAVWEAQYGVKA